METLKVGDVVRCKAGGPPMTLVEIAGPRAFCKWFLVAELQTQAFPLVSLEFADQSEPDNA